MKTIEPVLYVTPVLLVLAIGIILFVLLYQRRMLQHQVQLRLLQEMKQRQLLDATLQGQEDERRRVARDLHDDVGATLALVKLNVHQLKSPPESKTKEQNILAMLDDVIGSVRRISHDLMPATLEKFGLASAISSIKRAMPRESQLSMEFICNEPERRLEPKIELLLYRIVQEMLSNTLKHAQATFIMVRLDFAVDKATLVYTDDGKGFDFKAVSEGREAGTGLGLTNLQSRVNLLNGEFHLFSEKGKGVKVTIVVPVSYL